MSQISLSKWMKFILILMGVGGAVMFGVMFPSFGCDFAAQHRELEFGYIPWMIFIALTAIPCYIVLVLGWQIATSIAKDRTFSSANAKRLKTVSVLALATSIYVFAGNVVFMLLKMNHTSIIIVSILTVLVGIAISVASAVLSYLVRKAAVLQEQSDLTI